MINEAFGQESEADRQRLEEKAFNLRLSEAPKEIREKYGSILLKEQINAAKENRGKPVRITLSQREHIFLLASSDCPADEVVRNLKMERDWTRATSKKGRPPIGGAQDD